jgi:hypothetical protein
MTTPRHLVTVWNPAYAADARETHLYLTDFRSLYVADVGLITTDNVAAIDAAHVPPYYALRQLRTARGFAGGRNGFRWQGAEVCGTNCANVNAICSPMANCGRASTPSRAGWVRSKPRCVTIISESGAAGA